VRLVAANAEQRVQFSRWWKKHCYSSWCAPCLCTA